MVEMEIRVCLHNKNRWQWRRSSTAAPVPSGRILHLEPSLLSERDTSGRLYVLADGTVEVLRGDTQVAVVRGVGSIFGEMSVLLNRPHTATVRAASQVSAYVFDDAESFLRKSRSSWAACLSSGSTPPPPISSTSSVNSKDEATR